MIESTAYSRVEAALFDRGLGPIRSGQARCPAHEDRTPSLTVSRGRDGVLVHCHAGCKVDAIVEQLGLRVEDLFDTPRNTNGKANGYAAAQFVTAYVYTDERGVPLFEVRRLDPKGFPQ